MKPIPLMMFLALAVSPSAPAMAYGTHADANAPKANGDSPGDSAPLATGKSDPAPLDHANFPPPGGATNGAGPNPHETGPIDAAKAPKI